MVRRALGAGYVAALLLLACGGDPKKAPVDRKDGGGVGQPDAGEGEHDAGHDAGEHDSGEHLDAGGQPDAGEQPDAGDDAGQGIDFVTACLNEATSRDSRTESLMLSGPGTSMGIVRYVDPDAFGTSGTTPWLPARFVLARGATAECLHDDLALEYQVSHHNFDDSLLVTKGGTTWIWKQTRADYDVSTEWTVEAREGNQVVWGPVQLTLESCRVLNDSSDCSGQYL